MKSQKPAWWQFLSNDGSFKVANPDQFSRLYFPLANEAGLLSSISPDLHGDIKTSHNSFLTPPISVDDLHNTKSSRNFWIYLKARRLAWSATGMSAWQQAGRLQKTKSETVSLEAGFLWHKVTRINKTLGLRSEIVNFAPVSRHPVELMMITITNLSSRTQDIVPTCAIPIFARSADNLRDHYHVTSLLQRIVWHKAGVIVKPTMSFDERGHKLNELCYCVLGFAGNGRVPRGAFSTLPEFIGEGGNLEA
ncbi:MAG: cellobiose phosphorylase, partial [Candidatus Omnitrophota bacterium]